MLKLFVLLSLCVVMFDFCTCLKKFISSENSDKSLQVSTSAGTVQGRKVVTDDGYPYFSYQGIPYAQPPTGNLRFRSPVPANPWRGVLDATREQSGCIEVFGDLNTYFSSGDEDCLYVNIFTSKNPQSSRELLPVLVWIYGGAYLFGNSSTIFYGPDKLVQQDIIIVTFNYRVGMFGFLSTGDLWSPGNYGLKDQHLVLRWVQKNIKNFGGDKNLVTIAGQSAGASSVMYHMVSPTGKGLFHRAIAMSGGQLCQWALKFNPRNTAFEVGLGAGIRTKSTKELVAQLRKTDIGVLKKVSYLLLLVGLPQVPFNGFPFSPTFEPSHKTAFLSGNNTVDLLQFGQFNNVPIIMTVTTLETMVFADVLALLKPFLGAYDLSPGLIPNPYMNLQTAEERSEVGKKIKEHYVENSSYMDVDMTTILYQTSDDFFIRPLIRTIKLIYKYVPVYFGIFTYISEFGLNSIPILKERFGQATTHLEDVFYIWNWRFNNPPYPNSKDKLVSDKMLKLWKNFMITGNPTPEKDSIMDDVLWPTVTSENNITYLNISSHFSLGQNFRKEHMEFWDNLYQQYGHPPYVIL